MKFLYAVFFVFIFFDSVAQDKQLICGTKDEDLSEEMTSKMRRLPLLQKAGSVREKAGELFICRIAIEIDSETYLQFDKDTNAVTQKVLENIERVSEVYEKEINTRMVVTNIRIWKDTEPDPFKNINNIFSLLDVVTSIPSTGIEFDKQAYFYTKDITGGASGVAYMNGAFSVSGFDYAQLMMHEFGHNFGSAHTHNCNWPEGPIDFCADIEGNCYDKSLEITAGDKGTIMSYCPSKLTFHPYCQTVMKDHANLYLQRIQSAPNSPVLTGNSKISKGDFYIWPPVTSAIFYQVSYSLNTDFSGEIIDSVSYNAFSAKQFLAGKNYYARIKAVNALGTSAWSNAVILRMGDGLLPAPDILGPLGNKSIGQLRAPTSLSFSPVTGATGYDIQISASSDLGFKYPQVNARITETKFQFIPLDVTCYKWRIRAVNGEDKSRWSDVSFFSVNPRINNSLRIPIPDNPQNVPLSFPITYFPIAYYSDVTITVADNPDFINPIIQKEYYSYFEITDVIKNLPADKVLFFRVQERKSDRQYYPENNLVDYSFQFKTGNNKLSGNLTFLSGVNQKLFGTANSKIALTETNVWLSNFTEGFIRMDQQTLKHEIFNRNNTDGLLGFYYDGNIIQTDQNQDIHLLTKGTSKSIRKIQLPDDDPAGTVNITRFYFNKFIADYSPGDNLYWDFNTLYKESDQSLQILKTFDASQNIRQIRVRGGKIFVLLRDQSGKCEIVILDLASGSTIDHLSFRNNTVLREGIEQIEVGQDGKLWVKQLNYWNNDYNLVVYDGQQWTAFDKSNAPFGTNISAIALSPNQNLYVLSSGNETKILKYQNGVWEQSGVSIPLQNFGNTLSIDKNENAWITSDFGLARLTNDPEPELTLVTTDKLDYCETDSISVNIARKGRFDSKTRFEALLYNDTGIQISVAGLNVIGNQVRFKIPRINTKGNFSLKLQADRPETTSINKLNFNIYAIPTATLSTSREGLIPLIDTAMISIALTGKRPWKFSLWNGEFETTESELFQRRYVLPDPNAKNLMISQLSDKFCLTGNVKNSVRIVVTPVTSVQQASSNSINIYPNPTADKIVIELNQSAKGNVNFYLSDAKGSLIDSLKASQKITEWDISSLLPGLYILWTTNNSGKQNWKIVKK